MSAFVNSAYARGGVTGIGLITAVAGLAELGSVFVARARRHEAQQRQAHE